MDDPLHDNSLLLSKLKRLEAQIREMRSLVDSINKDWSFSVEEMTRERDAMQMERDTMQRERDNLQRERDTLKQTIVNLNLLIMDLKSERDELREELFVAREAFRSARPAARGKDDEDASSGTARMMDEKTEEILAKLSPFFNDEAVAKRYLKSIRGQKDVDVAMITNTYWEKGAFQKKARKTHLWRVLYDANLYQARENNWNAMVNFKRR